MPRARTKQAADLSNNETRKATAELEKVCSTSLTEELGAIRPRPTNEQVPDQDGFAGHRR